jgi:hypothetical protein
MQEPVSQRAETAPEQELSRRRASVVTSLKSASEIERDQARVARLMNQLAEALERFAERVL